MQSTMKEKEIRLRCWIEKNGVKFFGPGRLEILTLIELEGSLSKAAKRMGMSYKKAWDMVDDLNKRGQEPFVILRKGGEKGGGAEITTSGKKIIADYRRIIQKLQTILDEEAGILELV